MNDENKPMKVKLPVKQAIINNTPNTDKSKCNHRYLLGLEFVAGKRVFRGNAVYIDWTSNLVNAHMMKVTKYWCPKCNTIIIPPNYEKD